jgi:glutathione S-transferase
VEFLAINPNGKVPAMRDGAETYFESLAMIVHLGERYGRERNLWPLDGQARADALSYAVWSTVELSAFGMQYVYHGLESPVSYGPADRSKAAAQYCWSNLESMLRMLEQRLNGREHLLGDFTLADVPAAATLFSLEQLGVKLADTPAVQAYVSRCVARPAMQRVLGG